METDKIIWFDASAIIPLDYNPRFIKDDAFRKLQQSILRDPSFMEMRPILLNEVDGKHYIYAGTQRWKACKDLGWETVPAIVSDNLPEEIIKERMLKDNIHAGVWDATKLQEFDNDILDSLDISVLTKLKLNIDNGMGAGEEMEDGMNHKTKTNGDTLTGFAFNLTFPTHDKKQAFEMMSRILEKAAGKTIATVLAEKALKYV